MALRDLSDLAAVNAAIDEYERIGGPAFHTKYKSGAAVRYLVMRDGIPYDSKAIVAAAHGYQFGEPLDPADSKFVGGQSRAQPFTDSSPRSTTGSPRKTGLIASSPNAAANI